MLFVVDKPRFQRIIAIVRDDRTRRKNVKSPYLRLKAENTELTISGGGCVTATFPATVYQPGVLFVRTTKFRRLVRSFKNEKFLTFQVAADGLRFGNVFMPFEGSDMVLYPNPADTPESWPPPPPEAEQILEREAFGQALGYIREKNPSVLYFYSKYERTIWRGLSKRYPDVATEAGTWLYLKRPVTNLYQINLISALSIMMAKVLFALNAMKNWIPAFAGMPAGRRN